MEVVGLRAFADNYIWVLRHAGCAVVVDPGQAAPVTDHLRHSGDRLSAILITHHHPDHVGGLATLLASHDVPVYGPAAEKIPGVTHQLNGGDDFHVAGLDASFEVLDVGAHTRGHIAYYRPNILFCGDALFVLGCGRLFEGTPAQMAASLARIAALPRDTGIYCGHEYANINLPFALAVEPGNTALQARACKLRKAIAAGIPTVPMLLGEELDSNPFLRCEAAEVVESARNFRGAPLTNPVEVFAALREWRNNY